MNGPIDTEAAAQDPGFPPPFLRIAAARFPRLRGAEAGSPWNGRLLACQLLKAGWKRGVYRVRTAGASAILKLSFHALARWKLQSEARLLQVLHRRGIPVPRVLGWGGTAPGRYGLLLEELPGRSVAAAWEETIDPRGREALLQRLAQAVRTLHDARVESVDPHAGNVLADGDTLRWIDGGAMRLRPGRLGWKRRGRNLAAFHASFSSLGPIAPRAWIRALRAYLRGDLRGSKGRTLARRILRRSARLSRHRLRRRARRSLRSNRHFLRVVSGRCRAFVRRSAAGESWGKFLSDPESLFQGAATIKDGRSTHVARIEWNGRAACLKRWNRKSLLDRLQHRWRPSRSRRAWLLGHALEIAGVPTPQTIAAFEERRWLGPGRSYLVTEWGLGETAAAILEREPDSPAARILVTAAAHSIAKLHQAGLRHRDLKPHNLLFDPACGQVSFLDIDAASFLSDPRRRDTLLARDRQRFLRDLPADPALRARLRQLFESAYQEAIRS